MTKLEPTRTSSNLTATEQLRRLLDERGVEWADGGYPSTATGWCANGVVWHGLLRDGTIELVAMLTPEQAVAATLGPLTEKVTEQAANDTDAGTCKEVYLLMATDIGDGREEVLGVYATEEAAMAAINENQFGYALHHVRKWEVDS